MTSYADQMDRTADEFEEYARNPDKQGRISSTLFSPQEEHDGVDAPGWCLKQARKWRQLAAKKRKNFEHKQSQRRKMRERDASN